MKKTAFSLIEIVVVIVILAILASIAILKFDSSFKQSSILKIKSDLVSIQTALESSRNFNIVSLNNFAYPNALDVCSPFDQKCLLFGGIVGFEILKKPLAPCSADRENGCWEKQSDLQYLAWIDDSTSLVFEYDKTNGKFACDTSNEICFEIMK